MSFLGKNWQRRKSHYLIFLGFITFLPILLNLAPKNNPQVKCVQIFYDRASKAETNYIFGRIHATYLQNLLGHFPHIQQYIRPIDLYQKGDVEKCETSFYIGTHFNAYIPEAWFSDYVNTTKQVVWAGYHIWKLGAETLNNLWNVKFDGLTKIDPKLVDGKGRFEFFKYYEYKGETFIKYGEFDEKLPTRFNAAFEISILKPLSESAAAHVISWAHHSRTKEKLPYILRNANHWYIGDSPFSFATEEDRYLIFADLLFDMLSETPRSTGNKPALFRLEDIHPMTDPWRLYTMTALFKQLGIPHAITIIPIYANPLLPVDDPKTRFVPITKNPDFLTWLQEEKKTEVTFIFHGVSHQTGNMRNPWSGVTGEDFEFWDRVRNQPLSNDSTEMVISSLDFAIQLLRHPKVDITPLAWITPHYQASALDYVIFGQAFTWNIGRILYFPFVKINQRERLPLEYTYDKGGVLKRGLRASYFSDLSVTYPAGISPNGQFFPYEIYGDLYRQRMIPENAGNIQPYMNEQVHKAISVNDMIRSAKRNRVLRDTWFSFFIHPSQLNDTTTGGIGSFTGDTTQIERLVKEIQNYGYEFISLKDWQRQAPLNLRPDPIEEFL